MGLELVEKATGKGKNSNQKALNINPLVTCILCGQNSPAENYFCVSCNMDGRELTVPLPHEFRTGVGKDIDYLLSPELAQIGSRRIRHYAEDFQFITGLEIDYFWKKSGGGSGGKNTLGKCIKVTGPKNIIRTRIS